MVTTLLTTAMTSLLSSGTKLAQDKEGCAVDTDGEDCCDKDDMTEMKPRVIITGLLDVAWESGVLFASRTGASTTSRDPSLLVLASKFGM